MRFSLRTLLLLFPALIVSYALAYGWVNFQSGRICGLQSWHNQLNPLKLDLEQAQESNQAISVDKANRWFQGKLAAYNSTNWWLVQKEDNWGQPICCVALDENNNPLPEVDITTQYGFYTCGEDGVSQSHGNDPDDLNTWNSTEAYYQALTQQRFREYRQHEARWLTPWFFGAIICFWGLNHWVQQTRF